MAADSSPSSSHPCLRPPECPLRTLHFICPPFSFFRDELRVAETGPKSRRHRRGIPSSCFLGKPTLNLAGSLHETRYTTLPRPLVRFHDAPIVTSYHSFRLCFEQARDEI